MPVLWAAARRGVPSSLSLDTSCDLGFTVGSTFHHSWLALLHPCGEARRMGDLVKENGRSGQIRSRCQDERAVKPRVEAGFANTWDGERGVSAIIRVLQC